MDDLQKRAYTDEILGTLISCEVEKLNRRLRPSREYSPWDFIRRKVLLNHKYGAGLFYGKNFLDVLELWFRLKVEEISRDGKSINKARLIKWVLDLYQQKKIPYTVLLTFIMHIQYDLDQTSSIEVNDEMDLVQLIELFQPNYYFKKIYGLYKEGEIDKKIIYICYKTCEIRRDLGEQGFPKQSEEQIRNLNLYQNAFVRDMRTMLLRYLEFKEKGYTSIKGYPDIIVEKYYKELYDLDKEENYSDINNFSEIIAKYCDEESASKLLPINKEKVMDAMKVVKAVFELYDEEILDIRSLYKWLYYLIIALSQECCDNDWLKKLENINKEIEELDIEKANAEILKYDIKRENTQLRNCKDRMYQYLDRNNTLKDGNKFRSFIPKKTITKRQLYELMYESTYWELFSKEDGRNLLSKIEGVYNIESSLDRNVVFLNDFKNYLLENSCMLTILGAEWKHLCCEIDLWDMKESKYGKDVTTYHVKEMLQRNAHLKEKCEGIFLQDKLSSKTFDEFIEYMFAEIQEEICEGERTKEKFEKFIAYNNQDSLLDRNLKMLISIWNDQIVAKKGVLDRRLIEVKLGNISKRIDKDIAIEALYKCYVSNSHKIGIKWRNLSYGNQGAGKNNVFIRDVEDKILIDGEPSTSRNKEKGKKILECLFFLGQRKCKIDVEKAFDENILTEKGKEILKEAIRNNYVVKKLEYQEYLLSVFEKLKVYDITPEEYKNIIEYIKKMYKVKTKTSVEACLIEEELSSQCTDYLRYRCLIRLMLLEYLYRGVTSSSLDEVLDVSEMKIVAEKFDDFIDLIKVEIFLEQLHNSVYTDIELDAYIFQHIKRMDYDSMWNEYGKAYIEGRLDKEKYEELKKEITRRNLLFSRYVMQKQWKEAYGEIIGLYIFENRMNLVSINNMFLEKINGYSMEEKWECVSGLKPTLSKKNICEFLKQERISEMKELQLYMNDISVKCMLSYDGGNEIFRQPVLHVWNRFKSYYKWDMVFQKIEESEENFQIYAECYNLIRKPDLRL